MYLKQFIFVNWGNLPNQIFDFGPLNLLSGGNGSGKTTAADAIQTLMTAAHDNLYSYNPGQDESSQRTRGKTVRTLASYILGCDDGSYSRPHRTDGYLAANFYPSQGESSEPFSVVLHIRAHLEVNGSQRVARQDKLQFFILRQQQLTLGDFVEDNTVADGSKLLLRLSQRYPEHLIERYDRKKSYLARLYGALRGRDDSVSEREAMHCAKTFARFMAYKPVRSINDFVASEVLEKRDLGEAIRNISSLMKTIHGMEASAKLVRESIEFLEGASGEAERFVNDWLKANELLVAEATARYKSDQGAYVAAKRSQQALRLEIADNESRRATIQTQVNSTRSQLIQVEAQRQGVSGEHSLEREMSNAQKAFSDAVAESLQSFRAIKDNQDIAPKLKQLFLAANLGDITQSILEVLDSISDKPIELGDISQLNIAAFVGGEERLEVLNQTAQNHQRLHRLVSPSGLGRELLELLLAQRADLSRKHKLLTDDSSRLKAEISALDRSQANYPSYISRALAVIRRELPDADARVLCDYVSVDDDRWQAPIEGYLGAARFNIIVDEAFEAKAADLVRESPEIGRGIRVAQTAKAAKDVERSRIPSDSIVHIMSFDHYGAECFVKASFGSVVRVDTTRELAKVRRGLTVNGLGAAGYAMYTCGLSDTELVFGQGARERNILAKRSALVELLSELGDVASALQSIGELSRLIEQVQPVEFDRGLHRVAELQTRLEQLEQQQRLTESGDHGELEAQLKQLMAQESDLNEQLKALTIEFGAKQGELSRIDKKIQRLDSQQLEAEAQLELAEQNLRDAAAKWPNYGVEAAIEAAEALAEAQPLQAIVEEASTARDFLGGYVNEIERVLLRYNEANSGADAVAFMPPTRSLSSELFDYIIETHEAIDRLYNRLKNNVLAQKYEQLQHFKSSFDNTFVTHLCHAVYQAVSEGQRTLEELNEELKHHSFGADKERYSFGWEWDAEFKEYWEFFAEVTRAPVVDAQGQQNSLFNEALNGRFGPVRDRLMDMLLDEDEQRAMRALEDITDYRRYRRYEIYKTPEGKQPIALSQYGTGSGGQLETPAYIIRAAAITSAFKFGESGSHLRMVLVDEAFSKMDEYRSREVINYLTARLGLQLSFVMPTSKSGPFMDLISNQFVFAKVPVGNKRGELNTGVLVDRQALNQESVAKLWESHRQQLKSQSELEFLADL